MASLTWSGIAGNWATAANWLDGATPSVVSPGTADDALITAAGTYTVTSDAPVALGGLTVNAAGATLLLDASLALGQLRGFMAGTIAIAGSLTSLSSPADMDFAAGLLRFGGGANEAGLVRSDQTLSLGSGVTVDAVGLLGESATLSAASIVNAGTIISEAGSGGVLTLGGTGDIGNAGTLIARNGATLAIANATLTHVGPPPHPASFTNSGVIDVEAGAHVVVNTGNTDFQNTRYSSHFLNTGLISVAAGGTLVLDSLLVATPAELGTIVSSGGTVVLGGVVDATGGTLETAFTGAAGTVLVEGMIQGGTILANGGTFLLDGAGFTDVTWRGGLALDGGESLNLFGGLSVLAADGGMGTLEMSGGSTLFAVAAVTLDDMDILLQGGGGTIGGNGLAFGAGLTLEVAGGAAARLGAHSSAGSIHAGAAGALLAFGGQGFTNTGTILVDGGAGATMDQNGFLVNAGGLTVAAGATFTLAPGDGITNTGTLRAQGGRLEFGSGNTLGGGGTLVLAAGGVLDASLAVADAQTIQFADNQGNTLRLGSAGTFAARLRGFVAGDTIDLANVGFAAASKSYAQSQDGTTGVLTIGDGTITANLVLDVTGIGGLTAASFALAPESGGGGTVVTTSVPCFRAGTRLSTARGAVAVERLRPGDRLYSVLHDDYRPIRWIGKRRIDCRHAARPQDVLPVRVLAGAFGPGRPLRDLVLSPDHAVFDAGVLVPVRYLINGATVAQIPARTVTYYHVELYAHDAVLAEGLPAETYLDTGNRGGFAADPRAEDAVCAMQIWQAKGCAPLVTGGDRLAALRRRLREQAHQLGFTWTILPDVHLDIDGKTIGGRMAADGLHQFDVPAGARRAAIVSPRFIPAHGDEATDHRGLGIMLSGIVLRMPGRQQEIPLAAVAGRDGFHQLEQGPDSRWVWTDGRAELELPDWGCEMMLDLVVAAHGRGWTRRAQPGE